MTRVAFKHEWNHDTDTRTGEVFAYFPDEPWGPDADTFACYAHVGQHGPCAREYFDGAEWAEPEEYADLLRELVAIGYDDLVVVNPAQTGQKAA